MQIFWCRTEPWLASPAALRRFCVQAGLSTGDFLCREDLVPHAAGRYLLLQGFCRTCPGAPLPPLTEGPNGKPLFSGGAPAFNISHAGTIAVCAFSPWDVGIDIEKIAPVDPALGDILRPEERSYLQQLPEARRTEAFYQLWTRKESLIKARGGVLADLIQLESLITPAGRWKESLEGFRLHSIPFPDPAYVLSVSTRETEPPIVLTRLQLPG